MIERRLELVRRGGRGLGSTDPSDLRDSGCCQRPGVLMLDRFAVVDASTAAVVGNGDL